MTYSVTLEMVIVCTFIVVLGYLYCYISGKQLDKKYKKGSKS